MADLVLLRCFSKCSKSENFHYFSGWLVKSVAKLYPVYGLAMISYVKHTLGTVWLQFLYAKPYPGICLVEGMVWRMVTGDKLSICPSILDWAADAFGKWDLAQVETATTCQWRCSGHAWSAYLYYVLVLIWFSNNRCIISASCCCCYCFYLFCCLVV